MKIAFPAAVAACLLLCACSSSRGTREKILLFFEPSAFAPALTGKTPRAYPLKVQIKRFKIEPLYDNQKVIIRYTDYSVAFSRTGEWAVRPQITASDLLSECLKANFSLRALREGAGGEENPDLIITGEMKAMEEDLRSSRRNATVALTLKVSRARNDEVLFEETLRKSRRCGKDGYTVLAREFSRCLADIYRDFMQRLDPILSRMSDETREENKG